MHFYYLLDTGWKRYQSNLLWLQNVSKIVKCTNGTACPYLLPENLVPRNDSRLLSARRASKSWIWHSLFLWRHYISMTLMYSHKYFQAIEKIKLKKFILYFELFVPRLQHWLYTGKIFYFFKKKCFFSFIKIISYTLRCIFEIELGNLLICEIKNYIWYCLKTVFTVFLLTMYKISCIDQK